MTDGWSFDNDSGSLVFKCNSLTIMTEDCDGVVMIYLRAAGCNNGNTVQTRDSHQFAHEERLRTREQVEQGKAKNIDYFSLHPQETPSMSPKCSLYDFDYILHWLRAAYKDEQQVTKIMHETFGSNPAFIAALAAPFSC